MFLVDGRQWGLSVFAQSGKLCVPFGVQIVSIQCNDRWGRNEASVLARCSVFHPSLAFPLAMLFTTIVIIFCCFWSISEFAMIPLYTLSLDYYVCLCNVSPWPSCVCSPGAQWLPSPVGCLCPARSAVEPCDSLQGRAAPRRAPPPACVTLSHIPL